MTAMRAVDMVFNAEEVGLTDRGGFCPIERCAGPRWLYSDLVIALLFDRIEHVFEGPK